MAVAFGLGLLTKPSCGPMKDQTKTRGSGIKTLSPTMPNVLVLTQSARKRTLEPICRRQQHTAKILAFEMPTATVIKSLLTLQSELAMLNFTWMQFGYSAQLESVSLFLSPAWIRTPEGNP